MLVAGGGGGGGQGGASGNGGAGGGTTAGDGGVAHPTFSSPGGTGGSVVPGLAGSPGQYGAGTNGARGVGGNGGGINSGKYNSGGGGGGYYGGGGGFYEGTSSAGSGGGGGSSYTSPTLATNVVHTQGASTNTGNGNLTLSWTCTGPAAPTVTAANSSLCTARPSVILTATGAPTGATYTWSGGTPNANQTTVNAAGTYTAYATLNGCPGPASPPVTIYGVTAAPTITTTATTLNCTTPSATLTANGYTTGYPTTGIFNWQAASTQVQNTAANTYTTAQSATTTYRVTYALDGCTSPVGGPLTIAGGCPPTITVTSINPTSVCLAKGSTITVNYTTTGTFTNPTFTVTLYFSNKQTSGGYSIATVVNANATTGSAVLTLPDMTNYSPSQTGKYAYVVQVQNGATGDGGTIYDQGSQFNGNPTGNPNQVTVLALPTVDAVTAAPGAVTVPGQTVHLTTPAASGMTKSWYGHTETQYWQPGTVIAGQSGDAVDVIPSTSAYYSVVYTNSSGCSNRSGRVRVPFNLTISGTGTPADGVYAEGRGVELDGNSIAAPAPNHAPQYYIPPGADAGTQVYSTLFNYNYSHNWTAYFIIRQANVWEIYSGYTGTYYGETYTRIYHTQTTYATGSSAPGRNPSGAARVAATNLRPPASAVWIKDADNSTLTLTLSGVSEPQGGLPVTLTSFTAQATTNRQVALAWQTASEQTADYFALDRSADLLTFAPIGRVKASGNSSVKLDYAFADETPLPGLSYYRLTQVDLDGTPHTYRPVPVRLDGTDAPYPNPSDGRTITLDVAPTATIGLHSLTGAAIPFARKRLSDSSVQLIPTTVLPGGVYMITVNGAARKWVVE